MNSYLDIEEPVGSRKKMLTNRKKLCFRKKLLQPAQHPFPVAHLHCHHFLEPKIFFYIKLENIKFLLVNSLWDFSYLLNKT